MLLARSMALADKSVRATQTLDYNLPDFFRMVFGPDFFL
jgi:hypothetical protein